MFLVISFVNAYIICLLPPHPLHNSLPFDTTDSIWRSKAKIAAKAKSVVNISCKQWYNDSHAKVEPLKILFDVNLKFIFHCTVHSNTNFATIGALVLRQRQQRRSESTRKLRCPLSALVT
jgi:hypothetical protein